MKKIQKAKLSLLFRPEVRRQKAYHLEAYPKAIKLNQNELSRGLSPKIKQELLQQIKKLSLERYPQVQPVKLQQALAKKLKVKPGQILVSNGSNVLIQTLVMSAAVKGVVMAPEPTFALYRLAAESLGNRFVPLPLNKKDFSLDLSQAVKLIKKHRPQLIFLPNPNAPTGNLWPKESIQAILDAAPGLVVLDEAYHQFSGVTWLSKLKRYSQLVILQTFSKAYALGGGRIGYLVAHPEVVEQVSKVLTPYCVSQLSEAAALVALKHESYFNKAVEEVIQERDKLFMAMSKLSNLQVYPSAGNFLLFRVKNAKACFQFLLKHGVLLRDQSAYPNLAGCLRVSVGTPKENRIFLRVLKTYLK